MIGDSTKTSPLHVRSSFVFAWGLPFEGLTVFGGLRSCGESQVRNEGECVGGRVIQGFAVTMMLASSRVQDRRDLFAGLRALFSVAYYAHD